jgi:hypothetical protein
MKEIIFDLTVFSFSLIAFSIFSSFALAQYDPAVQVSALYCFPQTFVVNSPTSDVTCFLETTGGSPSSIDVTSLRLHISERSSLGIPVMSGSPAIIGDFNGNGIPDLQVKFAASQFKRLFLGLSLPGNYHYQISGNILTFGYAPASFPFNIVQSSPLFAEFSIPQPAPTATFVDYQSSFNGYNGTIQTANGFALSEFTQQYATLNGYVTQRVYFSDGSTQTFGSLNFAATGYLTVNLVLFQTQVAETFTVDAESPLTCSSITNTSTICQTSGTMIKQGAGIFADNGDIPVPKLIYEITPTSGTIIGFDANNNKILEIDNIPISSLTSSITF